MGELPDVHAPPRLVFDILDSGSKADDETLQDMWAGLLASACSENGDDESNLIFIGLLSGLASSEVRILNEACASARKLDPGRLVGSRASDVRGREAIEISGVSDLHRLDREIDHLRALGLLTINAGFPVMRPDKIADVTPSTLGLQMFARCCGSRQSPEAFFGLSGTT